MNKNKFKFLSLIIAVLLIITPILSCKEPNSGNNEGVSETSVNLEDAGNGDGADSIGETEEISRENTPDSLPNDLDFEGADYRILVRDNQYAVTEFVDEDIGEVVNDAIFLRQKTVEDRLNVNIKKETTKDTESIIKKSIKAGEDSYDIVAGYAAFIPPLALDGNFVNLADFPYIDYEKPWWPDTLMTSSRFNNKLYFISGDYTISFIYNTRCLAFNKNIAKDFGIPDLYKTVLDGDWTLDMYGEIAKSVYKDVNGDGTTDIGDIYGSSTLNVDEWWSALQLPLTEVDSDGTLQIAVYSEKFVTAYKKLYDIFYSPYSYSLKKIKTTNVSPSFAGGELLLSHVTLGGGPGLRTMADDYGFLPMPKWDKAQEGYYTFAFDNYSLLGVPITVDPDKYEMIGAVTEAVAAEGYRKVTPAYFDIALKNKYSRDDESSQMLDIIVAGNTFELGMVYSVSLGDVIHLFRNLEKDNPDITSMYEKKVSSFEKAFAKFNAKFADLD